MCPHKKCLVQYTYVSMLQAKCIHTNLWNREGTKLKKSHHIKLTFSTWFTFGWWTFPSLPLSMPNGAFGWAFTVQVPLLWHSAKHPAQPKTPRQETSSFFLPKSPSTGSRQFATLVLPLKWSLHCFWKITRAEDHVTWLIIYCINYRQIFACWLSLYLHVT